MQCMLASIYEVSLSLLFRCVAVDLKHQVYWGLYSLKLGLQQVILLKPTGYLELVCRNVDASCGIENNYPWSGATASSC